MKTCNTEGYILLKKNETSARRLEKSFPGFRKITTQVLRINFNDDGHA